MRFPDAGTYEKQLNQIKDVCAEIWNSDQQHKHYTRHGIRHSQNIIGHLEKLLRDQKLRKSSEGEEADLTEVEIFILQAACYLHDVGMQCTQPDLLEQVAGIDKKTSYPFTYEPLEQIRAVHGELSSLMIRNPYRPSTECYDNIPDLGLRKVNNLIVEAIARISKAHTDSDYQKYCLPKDITVPGGGARMLLLAVLLRLGDALDADCERCDEENYWKIQSYLPAESQANFWKHWFVSNVIIENGRVHLAFVIPDRYQKIIKGIRDMAEKYIRFHNDDLNMIWQEFNMRAVIGEPLYPPGVSELSRPMPQEVMEYFLSYRPDAQKLTPVLHIPSKYTSWILDRCENMDMSKLLDSRDKVIMVKMPEIFIPLYTDPLDQKDKDHKDAQEISREERKPIDIEDMITDVEYLLIEGQAGSGKTTLLKHLSYSIIRKEHSLGLGGYLPVLVFLKDLRNIAQPPNISTNESAFGEGLLTEYFRSCGLDMDTVKQYCQAGKAIFLIDGLDEIPSFTRTIVVGCLADLRRDYGCKVLLSGRPHGVEDVQVLSRFGDRRIRINNLNRGQQEGFIKNWFKYLYSAESGLDVRTSDEMIGEINTHPNVSALLDTPLMLTAICILYYNRGRLPEQRAALYQKFTDNLIYKRFDDPERVNSFMMLLAYNVHSRSVREFGRADALEKMPAVYTREQDEGDIDYRQRLDNKFTAIEEDCGLLKFERGHYEFWHLTFQEFLAARYIAKYKTRYAEEIKDYWGNDWYREVLELFIGCLSIESSGWAHEIIEEKLHEADRRPFRLWRLAARCLLDIHKDVRIERVLTLAKERLRSVIEAGAAPGILVEAGETLGWLGDLRNLEQFMPIAGGKYTLKELGARRIEPFEIGAYPVTNQWYQKFVEAKGYENVGYWSPEGKKWLAHVNASCPELWYEREWKCPNAPVVGVCWFEADAFCRWLTEMKNDGYAYRLPKEEEWQAAAAGKEGREYPWGSWQESRCNTSEAKIDRTSPVGIFVAGKTPEEVYDLSGNVWEWTQTDYESKENRDDFAFDLEVQELYENGKFAEAWDLALKRSNAPVLRGGSWYFYLEFARCAARYGFYPDSRSLRVGFRCSKTLK